MEEWYYELEKEYCKWEEHKVIIIGDLNAKVGNGITGIEGNHPEYQPAGKY